MAKAAKQRSSTINKSTIARMVGLIVAPCFIVPALYYNLHWGENADVGENLIAAVMVVGSAVIVEACRHSSRWWQVGVGILVALGLILANGMMAFENMALSADDRADHRRTAILDAQKQSSTRSEWSAIVDQARSKVGERSMVDLQSELDAHIAANAQKWNGTNKCDPAKITLSAAFCAEVAKMRGLVETARLRDTTRARIEELDAKGGASAVPTNADPYVANMTALLGVIGITPTEEGKKGIRSVKTAIRTFALEAMATFGPMLWLALIDGLIAGAAVAARAVPEKSISKAANSSPVAAVKADPATPEAEQDKPEAPVVSKFTPQFDRFCADELDEGTTLSVEATPAFKHWEVYCKARGLDPGSQKKFGMMMGAKFTRDANNGYPRYIGVGLKQKPPKFSVVSA